MKVHLYVCFSKVVHANRQAALAHVRKVGRKRKSGGKGLRPYRCPHCGNWHVGHTKKT
ncbi:MAG TPA: hypothetical protein VGZ22_27870 [Isosphaeraceae bacterium]|nr:hypothetical protein [Isosphaeraceae bacterium]